MGQEAMRQLVLECLRSVVPEAAAIKLDPELSFHDQLNIDSVDFLAFVLALEDKLGRRIDEADFPKLSSLDGCIRHLQVLHNDGSAPLEC
jgi:acyl carrier protein